jgi:DNA processing protein
MEAARTIRPGDGQYPEALARTAERPEALRVRGALCEGERQRRRVAVVGTRHPDEYGRDIARSLAAGLARAGLSLVSGGALGIDGIVHEAAVEAGGHTVVVLGTGVDVPYPARHGRLFERVLEAGGALVSEQPDGTPAYPAHFPRRNRIISGLCEAVVVVQAAEGSGALITASWARSQGVPVLAVPGDVRDPLSAGPTALLRQGAPIAASAEDVLAALGVDAPAAAQGTLPAVEVDLPAGEGAILAALARRPRHADEIARAARVPAAAALAGLLALEVRGLCEQRPGHYFLRRT